jgi:hypothetical protein
MRLIRVPHVFSFFAPRLSGCVGGCLAIRRATSVGLLGFAVLCGAILMGWVDAHAQAPWPSGPDSESIRAFGGTSEVTVISGGDIVAKSSIYTQTCAHATSKNPVAPCYRCPQKALGRRCVKTRSPAEIATCEVNTDGACTPECEEDSDHPANRPVVLNNRPPSPPAPSGGGGGGGARCRVTGAAAHYSQCCFNYCLGQCQVPGSPCGPWNPPPSNGGSSNNPSGPSSGTSGGGGISGGGSTGQCPAEQVRNPQGQCVSLQPPQPLPSFCFYQCQGRCCTTPGLGCTPNGGCSS